MVQNRKKRRWGAVCLGLCLLTACQQEIGIEPDPGEGIFLMYNSDVKPLAGATDKVRVIVFAGGIQPSKAFVSNTEFAGTSGKIPLQGGKYQDIYTIINEEVDLTEINTRRELEAVKINRNLPTDVNAVTQRYHYYKNIFANNDGTITDQNGKEISSLDTSEYTAAKVSVEFDITPVINGVSLKFTGAKLIEVPAYSYLLPRTYDGTEYGERFFTLPKHLPGQPFKHTAEVAVPEYRPAGDRVMTLVIQADRYENGIKVGSTEYRSSVGNSMAGATGNNRNYVDRNKVYKFRFTAVTGPGMQVDDWKVGKQVETWQDQKVDTEVGEAYGFFLQTELLDNFRAFRMFRYVNFRAEGPGKVWIDKPRDKNGKVMELNEFVCNVLWDDNSQKSGRLQMKVGNWQVGKNFDVYIKMAANNIERTLVVKCRETQFAKELLNKMNWGMGMGYQSAMQGIHAQDLNNKDIMIEYWSQPGPRNGCAGYWEGDANDPVTGVGCWRMATIREGLLYMEKTNKPVGTRYWAFEPTDFSNQNSYTSRYYQAPIPPLDSDIPGNFIAADARTKSYPVLCVLDDKLDVYYNIEVNPADWFESVGHSFAVRRCNSISDDGKGTWRLPTPEEAAYALKNAGTQGIPNNFNATLYWLNDGTAVGPANPDPHVPGSANVRCVRERWKTK